MTREELNQNKQDKIIDEARRQKRKKIVILFAKIILAILLLFTLFFLYNTYISTAGLVVREERIVNDRIPDNFDGIKVIQFSDLHYGSNIFIEELKNLVQVINRRKPDVVVFTGDLIDKNYKLKDNELELITKQLSNIRVSLGKYAIMGDEDIDEVSTIFNQSEFMVLNNCYDLIYKDNNLPILIVGVSSLLKKEFDIDKAYNYFNEAVSNKDIFTIGLVHEPDLVDNILVKYNTDLFLAGHSHNGNIGLPYLDRIYRVDGADKYYKRFYQLSNSKLYISSGVGTNGAGVRVSCQPNINFFRLSSK